MLGGYQILDLTNINLELGADAVDITDSGVLKQLLNLREYIEKGYDFSRPLNNQLKPFQVRYRDKKADEEITATLWASLSVIENGFIISASIPNYANLEIFVSFTEETDDDGNNYWAIDSAQVKYNLISSGTKLYRHELFIDGDHNELTNKSNVIILDTDTTITIDIISTNPQPFVLVDGELEINMLDDEIISIMRDGVPLSIVNLYLASDGYELLTGLVDGTNRIGLDGYIDSYYPYSLTDTVTEL